MTAPPICFCAGSVIMTQAGPCPVEELRPGDGVLTLDSGYAAIRWIGRRALSSADLAQSPQFLPIRIARGALGDGLPDGDLYVSPHHRLLIRLPTGVAGFPEREVLVAAKYLTGLPGIYQLTVAPQGGVDYWHFLLDWHQIVFSNGLPTESLFPGPVALAGLGAASLNELHALFPELRAGPPPRDSAARRLITRREAGWILDCGVRA